MFMDHTITKNIDVMPAQRTIGGGKNLPFPLSVFKNLTYSSVAWKQQAIVEALMMRH